MQARVERQGLPEVCYASTSRSCTMDIIRIIFAILLPPVGVFMQVGFAGAFWLNILLTLLGYIPGIIHAVYIIASRR
jgi:uncharacterized membrane protein YqaE (UPF0057 family)